VLVLYSEGMAAGAYSISMAFYYCSSFYTITSQLINFFFIFSDNPFLIALMRATCPTNPLSSHLLILIILHDNYKLCNSVRIPKRRFRSYFCRITDACVEGPGCDNNFIKVYVPTRCLRDKRT